MRFMRLFCYIRTLVFVLSCSINVDLYDDKIEMFWFITKLVFNNEILTFNLK